MRWSKRKEFDEFLIECGVVEFREEKVRLSSGRKSNLYINLRKLSDDVTTLDKTVNFVEQFVDELGVNFDFFVGVAEGATKVGLFLTYSRAIKFLKDTALKRKKKYPLVMARGKEKKHGSEKDKYYIGKLGAGDYAAILEDVLTTGDSLIEEINKLRSTGVHVDHAIGLVDRLEFRKDGYSVAEKLSWLPITYYSMTDVKTLLPLAYEKLKPSKDLVKKINRYYKKYGCEEVKISI